MQWVPKTAWKKGLTQYYGRDYVGTLRKGDAPQQVSQAFAGIRPDKAVWSNSNSRAYTFQQLKEMYAEKQIPFIDLRDVGEIESQPPPKHALPLHHHDILSGACRELLPRDRMAEIVVFASNQQRAVNGFNALRHHGYRNVVVADYESVRSLDNSAPETGVPDRSSDRLLRKRAKSLQ